MTKKRCFVGLGGAGQNSIEPFLKNEKNADFIIIDTDDIYSKYNCKKVKVKLDDKKKILKHFKRDREYIFILGLSYSKNKRNAGVTLMQTIGEYLKSQNKKFTMILGLPFAFEYGKERKVHLNQTRQNLENLATKTLIADSEKYREIYSTSKVSVLSYFHYLTWQNNKTPYRFTFLDRFKQVFSDFITS